MKIIIIFLVLTACVALKEDGWQEFNGKAGKSGWKCNVIQADPKNHGSDGINFHDWDEDGDLDVLVNYEEGKYSRLYFNPGKESIHKLWKDFIEFKHGKCEDSGIGDLDNDGDVDYIANGGWIYFNPGKDKVRDSKSWFKMTLFDKEGRVPTVVDMDGDGLEDLLIAGSRWYKQPDKGKHKAENWQEFSLGKTKWVMSSIIYDVDKDGDNDVVVQDRRSETFWFENPGKEKAKELWLRHSIYSKNTESMFMVIADVNEDGKDDFLITGGRIGEKKQKLIILLRNNATGHPHFTEVIVNQPSGYEKLGKDFFPKGIACFDSDGDGRKEILIVPKLGHIWQASCKGEGKNVSDWSVKILDTPGFDTRKKMDNAYTADLDSDGDTDIVTTEENGGWGVIWFENPLK